MRATAIPSEQMALSDRVSGNQQTDAGVIPKDWDVSSVGREFTIQLGKMLDAASNVGELRPYVGNRAIQWGQIDIAAIGSVPLSPSDMKRFRLFSGDLLVCEGGEIGRAAIWDEAIAECYYQKAIHRLRPTRGFNAPLLMYFLHLWSSTGYLRNFVTQTSIAHLPKERFQRVPLPVPPKSEQRAIAEALSDVDGLIGALEKLIAKKRAIKQAAMQQLLTGKTRLPRFGGEWTNTSAGAVGWFRGGNGFPLRWQGATSGAYPFYKVSDMNHTGNEVVMCVANHYISEQIRSSINATVFPEGAIVFAKVGAAIFLERKRLLGSPSCIDNNMMAYELNEDLVDRCFMH